MTRPTIRALHGVRQGGGGAPYPPCKQRTLISPHVRKDLVLGVCRAEVAVLPEPAE